MARCTRCGAENPDYVLYCGKCGGDVTKDKNAVIVPIVPPEGVRKEATKGQPKYPDTPVSAKGPGLSPSMVWCKSCGKLTEVDRSCSSCGNDPNLEPPEPLVRPRTPTPLVGGACAIAAGVLAVIQGVLLFRGEAIFFDITGDISGVFILLGVFEIVFGLASIFAGIRARKRVSYRFSLIGAVLGMVAFGFFIGGFLGLVAVILIALSHGEFKS